MKIEIIAERSGIYGGLKRLYHLAGYLIAAGHQTVINIADGSRNTWFQHQVPENRPIEPDVRIVPETWQKPHPRAKNVLYFQAQFDEPEYRYHKIVTTSTYLQQELLKMGFSGEIIPYGFDTKIFKPDPSRRVAGKIAYMPRKNASEANLIRSLVPKLNFKIIEGLTEQQFAEELQTCDILMSVSKVEGFGMGPPEAALCGCLIVGYHGFGGLDWLEDNKTYLAATCPEEIAYKLQQVIKNPENYHNIRETGAQVVKEKFSLKAEADAWVKILANL